jgi:hypothetical protein
MGVSSIADLMFAKAEDANVVPIVVRWVFFCDPIRVRDPNAGRMRRRNN